MLASTLSNLSNVNITSSCAVSSERPSTPRPTSRSSLRNFSSRPWHPSLSQHLKLTPSSSQSHLRVKSPFARPLPCSTEKGRTVLAAEIFPLSSNLETQESSLAAEETDPVKQSLGRPSNPGHSFLWQVTSKPLSRRTASDLVDNDEAPAARRPLSHITIRDNRAQCERGRKAPLRHRVRMFVWV